ncbi:nuclease-related domain-containing protein [uncultured Phycicoccus sp.]|uniref:nuclease-related domain-containing protein n=1 Tax=uncultured Phycicoccus sp. TaxID=661422 RepID=UPI0026027B77|nr:nuclease-related domain-containing protein [uncultured Phycicoccus sp.]
MSDVKVMRLRYAGECHCGTAIAKGERAAYDREAKRVLCLPCLDESVTPLRESTPAASVEEPDVAPEPEEPVIDVGVAGAAALREYERRKAKDDAARAERSAVWRALNSFFYPDGRQTTHAWKVGAVGEERVAKALLERTEAGAGYALHDRRVPGKRSNIDHLFVGAAGIFVIDAKYYKDAEVSVERSGGLFGPRIETLKVKNRKRDALVTAMRTQRDVVAGALVGSDLEGSPVVPVLCFVDGLLPMRERIDASTASGCAGSGAWPSWSRPTASGTTPNASRWLASPRSGFLP